MLTLSAAPSGGLLLPGYPMDEPPLEIFEDELAAVDRFIAEQPEPMARTEAFGLIIRDWLVSHGYLDLEPQPRPAN